LLIFKQEKFSVAHGKEISVQGGFFCLGGPQKKLLAGRYLPTPALVEAKK
jgi:hypothetical protein